MTYQVLARKWRPKDFASLVGQDHVVRALSHALDSQRLHHAYLFTGTRGIGKTTLSRILAKALNCEKGISATPCGVCNACRSIDEGRFIDYVEMDAASNRGVEEMASLLERAIYAPVDARFKVYMIDEVHMLTNHAFNAMLKTLEEPPAHVKFILATTDPQKIPVTVLSRCLQFNLKQMPATHIVGHLEHILAAEQIACEPQALRLLAKAADGSMRDALSLTDQAIAYSAGVVGEEAVRGMLGALDQSYLIRLLDAIAGGDGQAVLAVADEMASRSLSFSTALADLAALLHRVAWAQAAPASVLDEWPEAADVRRFAAMLSAEQVQLLYQIATIGRAELGLAPDEYAGFSMSLLRMLAFQPLADKLGSMPAPGGSTPVAPAGTSGGAGRAPSGSGRVSPAMSGAARAADAERSALASPGARPVLSAATAPAATTAASARGTADAEGQRAASAPAASRPDAHGGAPEPEPEPASFTRGATSADAESAGETSVGAEATDMATADVATASDDAHLRMTRDATQDADLAAQSTAPSREASVPDAADVSAASDSAAARHIEPAADDRPMTPARAALEALRLAGLRVPTDKSRAAAAVAPRRAAPSPSAPLAVPTPKRAVATEPSAQGTTGNTPDAAAVARAPAATGTVPRAGESSSNAAAASGGRGADTPPWEALPDAAYDDDAFNAGGQAGDDGFYGADDAQAPAAPLAPFDTLPRKSAQARGQGVSSEAGARAAASGAPVTEVIPKTPPVRLTELGHDIDWPEFVTRLSLRGFARELAFRSELVTIRGTTLELRVAVPQLGDRAHVDKLKAELETHLGRTVELSIANGAVHYTAAAIDDANRARRQLDAERSIEHDPFVQSLIRDFGASVVPGSIRPVQGSAGAASAR